MVPLVWSSRFISPSPAGGRVWPEAGYLRKGTGAHENRGSDRGHAHNAAIDRPIDVLAVNLGSASHIRQHKENRGVSRDSPSPRPPGRRHLCWHVDARACRDPDRGSRHHRRCRCRREEPRERSGGSPYARSAEPCTGSRRADRGSDLPAIARSREPTLSKAWVRAAGKQCLPLFLQGLQLESPMWRQGRQRRVFGMDLGRQLISAPPEYPPSRHRQTFPSA